MGKHRKHNRKPKPRRRVTMHYTPLEFKGSYPEFVRTMESFCKKTCSKLVRNPDGSITSVSPFGEVVTAVYGDLPRTEE